MDKDDLSSIFEQINNLDKSNSISDEQFDINEKDSLDEFLLGLTEEIQRVLDESDLTQEELSRITNMSQSNISKILNGKVVPKIETLVKIAAATNNKLIICFEGSEGGEE